MSEMDACIQQFFNTDSAHNFPLVKTPIFQGIPRNTGLFLMLLWPAGSAFDATNRIHTNAKKAVFPPGFRRKKERQNSTGEAADNLYFAAVTAASAGKTVCRRQRQRQ
jgi:hypothetical protein